ncbi:Lipase 2 precursor [Corynebacterium faecale]|uniref:SGNH/GDSL hydrolase family protein n=1 Tax=Corynebacterium faecale TaxID=1758466 RepID=UPI0025B45E9D|nr:SGNH/GDSL hydrolase family protein [Corynebacterium faecale]WJY92738.1 Lipase 2 precursor [Corynebacterium faecale]
MKRLLALALVVPVLVACSGEPSGEAGNGVAGEASLSYAALGDSFAAMGGRDQPLRGEPFCLRSAGNYPELVHADVTDMSCQGAVTDDLLRPRATPDGQLPAQLEALDVTTTLVTLSIGGNDLGFGDVAGCISSQMRQTGPTPCVEQWEAVINQRMEAIPDKLDRVHEQINERAGHAQVVVTGYLPLVAAGDCPELAGVSEADQNWAVSLTAEINRVVEEAAHRHGADFVLPDSAEDHTACAAPEQRWADIRGAETDAYPLHLTSTGHEAMAEAVRAVLDN